MSSLSISSGYSKKYKPSIKKNNINIFTSPGSPILKQKLPPLSPKEFRIKRTEVIEYNTNRFILPRNSLDKIVEDTNQEYESAIREYLKIKVRPGINDEEIEEDHSPLVKITTKTPNRFDSKSISKSVNNNYNNLSELIEAEKILEESIRNPVHNKDFFVNPKFKSKKNRSNLEEARMLLKKLKK